MIHSGSTPISPETLPDPPQDDKASTEQSKIEEASLETLSKRAEHLRTEKFKNAFSKGVIVLVYVAFGLISVTILCVAWHYLAPPSWHWIDRETLNTITTSIFSGSFFAIFGLYIRNKLIS